MCCELLWRTLEILHKHGYSSINRAVDMPLRFFNEFWRNWRSFFLQYLNLRGRGCFCVYVIHFCIHAQSQSIQKSTFSKPTCKEDMSMEVWSSATKFAHKSRRNCSAFRIESVQFNNAEKPCIFVFLWLLYSMAQSISSNSLIYSSVYCT